MPRRLKSQKPSERKRSRWWKAVDATPYTMRTVPKQYCSITFAISPIHYDHSCRIQLDYLKKESAAGRVPVWEPPQPEPGKSLLETVGIPAFTCRYTDDPELAMATSISKSMWTSNPGMLINCSCLHHQPSLPAATTYTNTATLFLKHA
jgi:hypothetical protein